MADVKITVTAYLDPQAAALLKRIAQAEHRSQSSAIALLILKEAAARNMINRAPEEVPNVISKKA